MHQSFKAKQWADAFQNDGFVVLPLLEKDEVEELIAFYQSMNHNYKTAYGFHVSIDDDKPDFIRHIHQKIISICKPKLDDYFTDIQTFSGRFLIKEPNKHSIVTPHQDWTFVDEKEHSSAIVWLSLVDVNIHNGALGVLKGSQKLPTGFRATPLPIFKAPYEDFAHDLFSYLEIIPMKAGEAMIMDNRLIHGSPPNISQSDRLVVGFEIVRKNVPLIHYHLSKKENRQSILKYEIDSSFFYHYSNAKLKDLHESGKEISGYACTGKWEYQEEKWDKHQFWSKMNEIGDFQENEYLKNLFEYSFGHTDKIPDVEIPLNQPKSMDVSKKKESSFLNTIKNRLFNL